MTSTTRRSSLFLGRRRGTTSSSAARCGQRGAPPSVYGFCTNGSYFAGMRNVPTIGYGPGLVSAAHSPDEYVAIEELEKAADGYRRIIEEILG